MKSSVPQVDKETYNFNNYVNAGRWQSYYHQLSEALLSGARSILYVGCGDRLVVDLIREIAPEVLVETYDFDESLKPDIVGDIREIGENCKDNYDCIICCQVLEHLPYECFEKILEQIHTCLNPGGCLVLSLPDRGRKLEFRVDLPGIHLRYRCKLPMPHRK